MLIQSFHSITGPMWSLYVEYYLPTMLRTLEKVLGGSCGGWRVGAGWWITQCF